MFCEIFSSILRVTSCSTLSALCPGQGVTTATCLTGMSGSLRLGIAWYAQIPRLAHPQTAPRRYVYVPRSIAKHSGVSVPRAHHSTYGLTRPPESGHPDARDWHL